MNKSTWKYGRLPLTGLIGLGLATGISLAGCHSNSTSGINPDETVVTVGTESIPRSEVIGTLEATHGSEAVSQLIDYHLVMQTAQAKGVAVTDEEVAAAMAQRQAKNPAESAVVSAGGPRLDALKRQVKFAIATDKLITVDVKAPQDSVKKFFAQYGPAWYDQPKRMDFGMLFSTTKTRADLMAKELSAKTKSFAQLVQEQTKAQDAAGRMSVPQTNRLGGLDGFPPAIRPTLDKLQINETTAPLEVQIGPTQKVWGIFRAVQIVPAQKASFAAMEPTVTMDYKLAQIAEKVVKQNPANPPFPETLKRTGDAIEQQQQGTPPSLRDVLNYILSNSISQMVVGLRNATDVKILDTNYSSLSSIYGLPNGGAPGAPVSGSASEGAAGAPAAGAAPAAAPASPAPK